MTRAARQSLAAAALVLPVSACDGEPEGSVPIEQPPLEQVETLGAPEDSYIFARPVAVEGSWNDTLYVLDQLDGVVLRFLGGDGEPERIGRKGEGPGEFASPAGLVLADDRIGVLDPGAERFLWIDFDGTPLGGFPTELREQEAAAFPDGRPILHNPGVVRRNGAIEPRTHLASVYADSGGIAFGMGRYDDSADEWVITALSNRKAIAVGPDGTVWMGDNLSPAIVRYDGAGRRIDSITRPLAFEHRGFSDVFSMAEYVAQEGASGADGSPRLGAEGRHHFADLVTVNGSVGPRGCAYFLTFLHRVGPGEDVEDRIGLDVFTPDGALTARYRLPGAPGGIHVDRNGFVILIDAERATVGVHRPRAELCPG